MKELEDARVAKNYEKAIYMCKMIESKCYEKFFLVQIGSIKHNLEDCCVRKEGEV